MIEEMIESSRKKGVSKRKSYEVRHPDIMEFEIFHYGTLIYHSRYNTLIELGGFSGSDRDAISTAMTVCGFPYYVSNAESNSKKAEFEMDGWYVIRE